MTSLESSTSPERLLVSASGRGEFGRFLCEAAIQSVHAQRGITGVLQQQALRTLYDLLLERAPSIGVAVSRAAALLEAGETQEAERGLRSLSEDDVKNYQPYWVTQARLSEVRGDREAACQALVRALGLTEDLAVRRFLQARLLHLRGADR